MFSLQLFLRLTPFTDMQCDSVFVSIHADFVEHTYPPEIVFIFAYLDAMQ